MKDFLKALEVQRWDDHRYYHHCRINQSLHLLSAMAFVVAKDTSALGDAAARLKLEGEIMKLVDSQLGAVARPSRVLFLSLLPKTRSGKLLRRAIQAVCEQRDPGDLTTMDDPAALQQIKDRMSS